MEKQVGIETIPVFINYENGETVCVCHRDHKRCDKPCVSDVVERDKYSGWEDTLRVDQYGKSDI